MKKFFSFVIIICGMMITACNSQSNKTMDPKEFSEKIKADSTLLVDVRTPEEYKEGHLKGALLINYHDSTFAQQVARLDKNKTAYVYCRSGKRSAAAQEIMLKQGFQNVINLDGGIVAWEKAALPVEK